MSPEAIIAVGTAVSSVLAGAGAVWGRQAKTKAEEASARSFPTSNGFAAGVKLSLADIQATQARQTEILAELMRRTERNERRVDALTDHLLDDHR